jgi:hypothetical protein
MIFTTLTVPTKTAIETTEPYKGLLATQKSTIQA